MADTVEVDRNALRQVLVALSGGGHLIRELQVTRRIEGDGHPITKLTKQYEEQNPRKPPHRFDTVCFTAIGLGCEHIEIWNPRPDNPAFVNLQGKTRVVLHGKSGFAAIGEVERDSGEGLVVAGRQALERFIKYCHAKETGG